MAGARRREPAPARQHGDPPVPQGPVRTCVGCRQRASATELLRVVVVDGELAVDTARRLPGRGAWLHPDPECLRGAQRKRAFTRALRTGQALGTNLVDQYFATLNESGTGGSRAGKDTESRSTRHESAVKLKP